MSAHAETGKSRGGSRPRLRNPCLPRASRVGKSCGRGNAAASENERGGYWVMAIRPPQVAEGVRQMGAVNKVAIVTGAGTGVGRAVTLALLQEGYSVALAGRRKEPLDMTIRGVRSSESVTLVVPTDVTDPASVRNLFARTKQ